MMDADVIIIGAGPAGLSAAMDLDSRGVRSIVVEQRPFLQPPSVKSNHVSARTMESFRRLGVAQKVRDAGLPPDYPNDVAFRTTMAGEELARIHIPCRQDRYTSKRGPDTGWETPEPAHRINQTFLEPVLAEHVAALPLVRLLNETTFERFEQDAYGVSAFVTDNNSGAGSVLRARFIVGADGGSSKVRKQIGAVFEGDPVLQNVQSTLISAPGLYEAMPGEKAWCYYTYNPRRNGHVYAIDGKELFLVHNHLSENESAAGGVNREESILHILGVQEGFPFEILSKEDWTARRLVATRFRDRRAFICGDAAHLWVPYAGYGMNAGIADALNLTWVLSAYLQGWGDEEILGAYEAERMPITNQVSKLAMAHQQATAKSVVPEEIEEDSPRGQEARERLGREAYTFNVRQFAAAGVNFGYVYEASPIIGYDGEPAPGYTLGEFTPSTAPGCRAPHFWLSPELSIYDELGSGYTLLRTSKVAPVDALIQAAAHANLPLKVVDVPQGLAPESYRHALIIVRGDQHVAWRGDAVPTAPHELVELLRGAAVPRAKTQVPDLALATAAAELPAGE